MRVGKGRCDKRLAQRKLSSNQRSENRHLAEWRFSPLIRIVTVYPKICSVIVIGISTTSSRRCDQPPAVRAAPDRILPSSAYSVKKPALLHESALAHSKQKTGIAFWPTPWPTNRKTGADTVERRAPAGDRTLWQNRQSPLKPCERHPYRIFTRMRPLVRVQ